MTEADVVSAMNAARRAVTWRRVAAFFVSQDPKAQPRGRSVAMTMCVKCRHRGSNKAPFCRICGGAVIATSRVANTDDKEAKTWKAAVVCAGEPFRPKAPLEGLVRVDIDILLPRPKYLMKPKSPAGEIGAPIKPDRDNLDKAILDALVGHSKRGEPPPLTRWFKDDAIIVAGGVWKFYCAKDGTPGARIVVSVPKEGV